jgi:hypothetical protein
MVTLASACMTCPADCVAQSQVSTECGVGIQYIGMAGMIWATPYLLGHT